uniref:Uncharacterized protein n=1 Tax=Oryza sativa subsp. japonica TaxID=39947 RepID=Q6K6X7_ORYSJ|nr:hypothetical protein [Oryza sativa Japonica Group]BAD19602.1 hypothetical protein [Oryza sativa Japonica Group]
MNGNKPRPHRTSGGTITDSQVFKEELTQLATDCLKTKANTNSTLCLQLQQQRLRIVAVPAS